MVGLFQKCIVFSKLDIYFCILPLLKSLSTSIVVNCMPLLYAMLLPEKS